jgi:polysaccharide biosynthesis transport protein
MKSLRDNSGFPAAEPGSQAAANTVRRMPSAGPQEVFFHLDFMRSLQMHRKLALGIFFTFLALSLGYMAKRWNTYKAAALVYVQPSPHRVIENGPGQQWPYDANTYESYIQQQVHDVTRPDVLTAALKQVPGWQGSGESAQAAADRLGSAVEVTRLGSAYEVQIEATASNAQEAAQLANAVAGTYIDSATREQRAGDTERVALLREEHDRIVKELASDRTEQEDLNRKLGVAAVSGATPDPIDDQIAQTRGELVKARTASDEAAAKLTSLSGKGAAANAALDAEAEEIVAADPGLVSMKTALNKRRSDLISQMANLTPNHPQYKQDAEELAKINTSLDTMSHELRTKAGAEIEQKLKNDLERTSSVEARLNGQLAQLTGAAGSAAPRMQRLSELATDIQRLQNRFTSVDDQYRNLTMEDSSPGAVYLASSALPPLHAARAKVLRNGLIVILAGLLIAMGSALVAHNFDKRVYIAEDVERVLGFAPMAQIPDLYEVGAGVAEEYMLRLAAAVEHAHQQGLLSSCIFTGITAGAGVTTVSSRVAGMLEAMGRETVLVDAVGAPKERVEPAGNPGAEMVHAPRGSRSTALLQQMNEEAGGDSVVVTDTAPLPVSGETEYLARFVDSAIVVIESGVTTKAQLRAVAQTLQRLEVSSVGFVLNRISLKNANPAFRESVRAVESHLRSQARAAGRPAPQPETPGETAAETQAGAQAFEHHWSAAEPVEQSAAAYESVAVAETRQVVEEAATLPFEAPVAEAAVTMPMAVPAVEPVVREAVQTEFPRTERWGLPEYTRRDVAPVQIMSGIESGIESRIEETVVETILEPAIAPAPAAAAAPEVVAEPSPAAIRSEEKSHERPAAHAASRAYVARPMRGRQTVRFTSEVESRQDAPAPAQAAPEAERPAVHEPIPAPQLELVPAQTVPAQTVPAQAVTAQVIPEQVVPAQASATAEETVVLPAADAATIADFAEAAAARKAFWVEIHEPSIVEQPVAETPAVVVSEETVVAEPIPEPVVVASVGFEPEAERTGSMAASRLSGLRTLMTSLGVKNLHKELELRKTHLELTPVVERPIERPVYAQPETLVAVSEGTIEMPIREVMALPEIIPPRNAMEHVERESELRRPVKSTRVSRWESMDDVETLPSKRGQYRKRH